MVKRVVLLPGMDGTGELFDGFVKALPPGVAATVVSYPRDRELGYDRLLRIVERELPEGEDFVLVAESFSVPLAIRIAVLEPPNLMGVVLCAGFVVSPIWKGWAWMAPALFLAPLPGFAARWFLVGRTASARMVRKVRAVVGSVDRGVMAERLRAVLDCDVREELRRVEVPLLALAGAEDRLVDVEEMVKARPGLEVVRVAGPHLILQCEVETCVHVVVDFLGQVGTVTLSKQA